jgi:acetyl esterase/lipase
MTKRIIPYLLSICVFYFSLSNSFCQSLLEYSNRSGKILPVKTRSDWSRKRIQILDSMQAAMGKLPATGKTFPTISVVDSIVEKTYTRFKINLMVEEDEPVTAYLYVPLSKNKTSKYPAMLALHETDMLGKGSVDGQGKNKNLAYARELADRGYVVIAPDYPSFGDSKDYDFKSDRYQSGTMKGIFNHIRCVDFLVSQKNVDPNRIGVIGHSLGGHNALFVGAMDTRLKVVVSSCGWTLFDFYNIGEKASKAYGGRLGPWAQERYMPLLRKKYQLDDNKVPFDFDAVISAIAPRAVFAISPLGDTNFDYKGVEKGIAAISGIYQRLGVPNRLQVRYPQSNHDFPEKVRFEAYQFIDEILKK